MISIKIMWWGITALLGLVVALVSFVFRNQIKELNDRIDRADRSLGGRLDRLEHSEVCTRESIAKMKVEEVELFSDIRERLMRIETLLSKEE